MTKFDVVSVGGDLFVIVQADHLLALGSTVVVPVLPKDALPSLRGLTVDIEVNSTAYRIRAHMPVTVEAARLRRAPVVYRLSADEGQQVMDGLYRILWGL